MASREERMQQRLRGAQRRQVKDVDFGLVFPAAQNPLQPVSSNRQTPQPDVPTLETPTRPSSHVQPAVAGSLKENNNVPAISHTTNDANTSAKRRKLDSDKAAPSSGRSTRSSRSLPRPDIYTLDGDRSQDISISQPTQISIGEETVAESVVESNIIATPPIPRTAEPSLLPPPVVEKVSESLMGAPESGNMTRVNTVETSFRSSPLQSVLDDGLNISEIETPVPQNRRKRKRNEVIAGPIPSSTLRKQPGRSQQVSSPGDDLDELSPEQPMHREKRNMASSRHEVANQAGEPDELENAEAIDDEEAAIVLKKNKRGRKSRDIPVKAPDILLASSDRRQKRRPRPDSSPAKQRHPVKLKTKSAEASTNLGKKSKVHSGSPIPVTVHRLTKPLVYDGGESDVDILNSAIPHSKRGGVNAIDVLSQVCHEIVGAGLDVLEDGGNNCDDSILRREYKTKWRAVQAFGNELQTRLLEHTINLDNSYSLERRLREEKKKRLNLREEVIHIRQEREQIALRMDEVRIKHEREKEKAQDTDTLNAAVHDIELAIDMGKSNDIANNPNDKTGIELVFKKIANEVSNKGDKGGILRQIREFNSFLERAALALEARKA